MTYDKHISSPDNDSESGLPYLFHPVPVFSREMDLLRHCCGPRLQPQKTEGLRKILRSGVNWDVLLRLASWHYLLPLLYWNLIQIQEPSVPTALMDSLKRSFFANVRRSLRMVGDLLRIIDTLEDRGVVAVPYKGPVLASRLYGSIALRFCSDLDILVQRNDVENARGVLRDHGYSPSVKLEESNQRFQLESRYSERFDRADSIVELHWAFTNKDAAFPLSLCDLMPRLQEYPLNGSTLRVFSDVDLLLILTVHGAKHFWNRLEWICGVAELLHKNRNIDWQELLSRAEETRSSRKLFLGVALAHDLFGAAVPEEIRQQIESDRRVSDLASQVTDFLFDGQRNMQGAESYGRLEHDLFHFRLGDHFADSVRYLTYRVTTPDRPERWSTLSIGSRSVSLHSFTRPIQVSGKLISALWHHYLS